MEYNIRNVIKIERKESDINYGSINTGEIEQKDTDVIIAQNIVRKLFYHINMCLTTDRSRTKLNMLEKGIIKGMLSDKTIGGINGYIANMYPGDVESLMNDIETEIKKRGKI